jgi:hypothetical protein
VDQANAQNGRAADPRRDLAQRVASSRTFARSARLPQFLLYVCDRALTGRTEEITEQQIGVQVFGRPSDYSSGEDNIVRVHARLLRKKLEEYFEKEGAAEPVRILIPKGGYAPAFEQRDQPPSPPPSPRSRRPILALTLAALALLLCAAYYFTRTPPTPYPDTARFWRLLFHPPRPTVIVPSDTALVLYQRLAGRELTLSQYMNRQFDPVSGFQSDHDPGFAASVSQTRSTNMPDMEFLWRLSRSPALDLSRTTLRYARELRIGDLKDANAILIGARRANPWVELFLANLNFQALYDPAHARDHILNRSPAPNEQPFYIEHDRDGQRWSYSVLALLPGLNGQGNVLIAGGTTTAGTEGAIDFVMNATLFNAFLRGISAGKTTTPHFEVLLKTGNVAGNARQTEIVAHRVHIH